MKKAVIGLFLAAAIATVVSAQSVDIIDLEYGFVPDPVTIFIDVELYDYEEVEFDFGPIDVYTDGSEEHVGLNYEAGDAPLYIQFISDDPNSDAVLIVVTPEGEALTNDDLVGLDPGILIEEPSAGYYAIGVGSWTEGPMVGTLYISETGFEGEAAYMYDDYQGDYMPVSFVLDNEMQISYEDEDYVIIEPDAGRRVANIVRYYIPYENFDEFFPAGYEGGSWEVFGYTTAFLSGEEGVMPDDPRAQAPVDGFTIEEWEVWIESVE